MIFSTFNQLNNFLIFIFVGLLMAFFYSILEICFLINFKKKLKNIIFNSVFYIFFAVLFVILLNIFNFGKFNISLLLATIGGYVWFRNASKNLVVFLKNKWYNTLNRLKRKTNAKQQKKS